MVRCLNCMGEYEEQYEICPHCGFVRGTGPKEAYHLYPGVLLHERYLLGTVLGFGGFGITYRAWDVRLERQVAIKEYYPSGIVNRIPGEKEVIIYSGNRREEFEKGKERFLTEARNMAKFNQNPHIVHVFEFFEENQTAYIAMEFLDGISFKEYIARQGGQVDVEMAVTVVSAIAKALGEIHRTKIIHRDVSPDNIFICRNQTIKLIDFGAARFSTGEEEKTMSVILKPGYAPPEQYRSKSRQGPWTDIYALGAVLYRSLTGRMPMESSDRMVKDQLAEPKTLNPKIPDYLNDSIMRAMALNQDLRFQNTGQFLKAIQNEKKVLPVEKEIEKRKMSRRAGIGAIAAVLLAGGAACVMMYQTKLRQAYEIQADLQMWIRADGSGKKAVYEEAAAEFNRYYPNIKISVEEIAAADYEEKLKQAEEKPDIFESTGISDSGILAAAEPAGEIAGQIRPRQYYFLGEWLRENPEESRIPVGLEIPVIYVNVGAAGETEPEVFAGEAVQNGDFCMDAEDAGLYQGLLDENLAGSRDAAGSQEDFLGRESAVLLGTSGDYEAVQERLTGLYELVWPSDLAAGEGELKVRFSEILSVSSGQPETETEAAGAFLNYLVSEPGQDVLNVRGNLALPLNKNMFEEYVTINGELRGSQDRMGALGILEP